MIGYCYLDAHNTKHDIQKQISCLCLAVLSGTWPVSSEMQANHKLMNI